MASQNFLCFNVSFFNAHSLILFLQSGKWLCSRAIRCNWATKSGAISGQNEEQGQNEDQGASAGMTNAHGASGRCCIS